MSKIQQLTLRVFFLFTLFLLMGVSTVYGGSIGTKHILVVFSYHKGMTWVDSVYRGLESGLTSELGDNVELHVEYMDSKRYTGSRYEALFRELITTKYSSKNIDCIIVSDDNALNIMLEMRDALFPSTPIIFCGVNYYDPDRFSRISNVTGVVEAYDVRRTIQVYCLPPGQPLLHHGNAVLFPLHHG